MSLTGEDHRQVIREVNAARERPAPIRVKTSLPVQGVGFGVVVRLGARVWHDEDLYNFRFATHLHNGAVWFDVWAGFPFRR